MSWWPLRVENVGPVFLLFLIEQSDKTSALSAFKISYCSLLVIGKMTPSGRRRHVFRFPADMTVKYMSLILRSEQQHQSRLQLTSIGNSTGNVLSRGTYTAALRWVVRPRSHIMASCTAVD